MFWFSQNWEKKCIFWPIRYLVFFFNWEISSSEKRFVDSFLRNSWKYVKSSNIECHLDLLTLSQSFVYLEQLVLKNRITKINRKYCAGACLILAGKLNDVKGQSLTHLIEVSKAQFLSFKFLLNPLKFSLTRETKNKKAE